MSMEQTNKKMDAITQKGKLCKISKNGPLFTSRFFHYVIKTFSFNEIVNYLKFDIRSRMLFVSFKFKNFLLSIKRFYYQHYRSLKNVPFYKNTSSAPPPLNIKCENYKYASTYLNFECIFDIRLEHIW